MSAALAGGGLEVLLRFARRAWSGELLFDNVQIVWLAPLSVLALTLPAGVLVTIGRRYWPHLVPPLVARSLVVWPAIFGLCWMAHPRIHGMALLAVSLGVAAQLGRLWERLAPRLDGQAWRTTGAGLAMLTMLAGAVNPDWWWPRRDARSRGDRATADGPNVILLVLDTVRAKSLSLYGHWRHTSPALERLASRGATFEHAVATSSWTLPSHASLFTGRYPFELTADWRYPLNRQHRTLAEAFASHGYATAGFVANLRYAGRETGLARGFAHYEDWPLSAGRLLESSSLGHFLLNRPLVRTLLGRHDNYSRKPARHITNAFLRWLDEIDGSGPFFAFLNYYDAHEPYLPPSPFDAQFGRLPPAAARNIRHDRRADGMRRGRSLSRPAEVATELLAYESAIAALDAEIGRLANALDRRGLGDETIVVVTSDHGESHGERGLFAHGNSLYDETLRVPLVISFPGRVPFGAHVWHPVSLRDLPATIADLARLPARPSFPGTTLLPLMRADSALARQPSPALSELWPPAAQDPASPVARGYMRSLAAGEFHYIRNGDGEEELYSIWDATGVDLTRDPSAAGALARLRIAMDSTPPANRGGHATPRARPTAEPPVAMRFRPPRAASELPKKR